MRYRTVTTVISENKLEKLKEKTGESSNKEALSKAINHYVICPYVENEKRTFVRNTRSGRRPIYLEDILRSRDKGTE